jgi:sugar phosphate permease
MSSLGAPNLAWEMRIVVSMCLGYGMLMLCRTVVGVAGPAMLADPTLTLDTATFGAILGWGTAGNLTGKLTTGVLADRLGGSRVFVWAVGLAAATTFVFGNIQPGSWPATTRACGSTILHIPGGTAMLKHSLGPCTGASDHGLA